MPATLTALAAAKMTLRSSIVALPATVRRAAERATMELPFRVPNKEWFSLREAAVLCGMSESFIEAKFDEGTVLSGHEHNAGAGARMTKRIPRAWLIAYLISTARYDVDALVDAYVAAGRQFSPEAQRRVIAGLAIFSVR